MSEIKIYYNVEDSRYYIYDGEDYVANYTNQESALLCFRLAVSEAQDNYKEGKAN